MKLDYRKDIDGLRAIAVLAVVLNHARIPGFTGGYIGVDVFFVISGFLITTIIAREIEGREFTFARFYERRIRRILPALVGMVIFVLPAGFLLFDATKIQALGKSLVAALLFYSNINFWLEAGYFDAPSQLKPLLHTWSLAVEEQFYILFPFLMTSLSAHARKRRSLILFIIMAISLGAAIYQVEKQPAAAFYLAHFRVWELLTGALLALGVFPSVRNPVINTALGLAGLAAIAAPVFLFTESTPFPGLAALPAVAGTALVIHSNSINVNAAGKILGQAALVFVGKISYSLYLWHWPLFLFARYYLIRPMTVSENCVLIIITLFVSVLSWRFIETPFRKGGIFSARQIFSISACAVTVILAVSGGIYFFDGILIKNGILVANNPGGGEDPWILKDCNINSIDNPEDILTCRFGDHTKPATIMIWGDSHAPFYGKGAHIAAQKFGVAGVITYAQGCPPYLGMVAYPSFGDLPCDIYNDMVIDHLKAHPEIKIVILASRMTIYLEGTPYKQEEATLHFLTDTTGAPQSNPDLEALTRLGLGRTIRALQDMDRQVIIIVPVPEIGYDVPSAAFIAVRTGRDVNQLIAPSLAEYLARSERTRVILNDFKIEDGVQLLEPWQALCQDAICRVAIDEIPLYLDDDHLSVFGSEFLTHIFDPIFSQSR